MVIFVYDDAEPDKRIGIVQGTLSGEPGDYIVQFRLLNSKNVFAGPVEVTPGDNGSAVVRAPIKLCQSDNPPSGMRRAQIVAQYKQKDTNSFEEENTKDYYYMCKEG